MIRDPEQFAGLLDVVRRFVRERLIPREAEVAQADAIPADIRTQIQGLGLFGLSIPEEYGGLNLTMEEEVQVAAELGQASPAFRSLVGTNIGIGSQALVQTGTAEQKRRYLPELAAGNIIGSFCLTEPEAGSDAASLRTIAVRDGDSYVLNGTKRYITNAPLAGIFTVLARTGPLELGTGGISAFIVERDSPGLGVGKVEKKMGQQGAPVADVTFSDCRVPAGNLIGLQEGVGFKMAMKVLDKGRLHIAAVALGAAHRMLRDATKYAVNRRQFGRPISDFQLIQAMLADSQTEIYAARSMILDAARQRDEGFDVTMEASCAKLFSTEMCGRVADRAVQILGGAGYIADYGVERFYRDVRLFRLYEGTSQIQQLIIARRLLEEARQ